MTTRLTRDGDFKQHLQWSPDGKRLLFTRIHAGKMGLWTMNADGSDLKRLLPPTTPTFDGHWSPDGKAIVFESYRDGNMEIYVMAPDGTGILNLSNEPKSDEHGPSWSPDGRRITYYSNRDGSWDIFVMQADGGQKVNLTLSPASEQAPVWQPVP